MRETVWNTVSTSKESVKNKVVSVSINTLLSRAFEICGASREAIWDTVSIGIDTKK